MFSFFCYHTSHLYYVCIDGVASIKLYGDARSYNYLVPGSVFILPPYAEKPSEYILADADSLNWTRAANAASNRAIH